jgi:uncharacterized protein (TIRG00374 family)
VLLSGAFLWATLVRADAGETWRSLAALAVPLLVFATGVCVVEVAVRAVRWQRLLSPTAPISVRDSFTYICIGHFANTLLPLRLGDIARAYLAGGRFAANRVTVLGTILMERMADTLLLGIVLAAGLMVAGGLTANLAIAALAVGGTAAAAIVLLVRGSRLRAVQNALKAAGISNHMTSLAAAFKAARSPSILAMVAFTTAASFACAMLTMHLVLTAAGTSLPWWETGIAISAMTLSTAIPAAPGSIGTYEFAGTSVLATMGVPAPVALASVTAVHLIATLPPAAFGLVATVALHLDVRGLRDSPPNPALLSTGS